MKYYTNYGLSKHKYNTYAFKNICIGQIKPEKLITHHFKLDEIVKAYEVFGNPVKEQTMKVIIAN